MGGAPSVGAHATRHEAPTRATTPDRRYDSSASFAYGQAGGAARRSRDGRRGLRRRRRRGGTPAAHRPDPGRHPELRRRPGAHRVQQQHLQGQRHLGGERHQERVPGGVQPDPGLQGPDERDLLDSAEQTSEDPQTVVYKIKQNAVWSDDTPVSADDFIYLWENCNGKKDNDVASTTGYDQIESVTGSDNGKTVTVVYKNPFPTGSRCSPPAPHPRPLHGEAAGRLEHRARQEPREDPLGRLVQVENYTQGQSLTLVRNDKYYGPRPPGLDRLPLPARVDHPAGGAAEQRGRPDLPAAPARPGPGQGPARRDQPDQLRADFEHLDFNFKNKHLGDLKVRQAIAKGINVQELVDRTVKQFSDKASRSATGST